jgi:hypothetical protein
MFMRKILLNVALILGCSYASMAQFAYSPSSGTATGMSFSAADADYHTGVGAAGCFGNYFPEPTTGTPGTAYTFFTYGGTVYANNDCATNPLDLGAGVGPSNADIPNTIKFGLKIATGYTEPSWDPGNCVLVVPTFGFTNATECGSGTNNHNPLADVANPKSMDFSGLTAGEKKLYVNYIGVANNSATTLATRLQLYRNPSDDAGNGVFGNAEADQPAATFILDGVARQLEIDFSGTAVANAAYLEAVRQISFGYFSTEPTDCALYILGYSIGSAAPIALPEARIEVKEGTEVKTDGSSYTFSSVAEGESGTAVSFSIKNLGSEDLAISSIALDGADADQFDLGGFTSGAITVGAEQTFTISFSPSSTGTKTASVVISSNALGASTHTIVLGGDATPATSISDIRKNITNHRLYPNPTSDMTTIELELKHAAHVKVTIADLMGKEIKTIADGTMSDLNQLISVGNLQKGIYYVTYVINGQPAKTERLLVK